MSIILHGREILVFISYNVFLAYCVFTPFQKRQNCWFCVLFCAHSPRTCVTSLLVYHILETKTPHAEYFVRLFHWIVTACIVLDAFFSLSVSLDKKRMLYSFLLITAQFFVVINPPHSISLNEMRIRIWTNEKESYNRENAKEREREKQK